MAHAAYGVIALHLPYSAYNLISAALAFVGVWLLIRRSPLPVPFLVALPFTYYLCYQYAVIARSYSLLAPLLFAAAAIYRKARERPFLFTALILLIAGISVHGVIISGAIWLSAFGRPLLRGEIRNAHRRRVLGATAVYALVLVALMLAAWPAKDVAFVENRGMSRLQYLPYVTRANLEGAFTEEWMTSIGVVLLSVPFLRAGGGLLFFIAVAAGLLVFGAAVYAQIWHFGILFLAWVFALWISAQHVKMNPPAAIALAAVIVCQCYGPQRQSRGIGATPTPEAKRQPGISGRAMCTSGSYTQSVIPVRPFSRTSVPISTPTTKTELSGTGRSRIPLTMQARCSRRRSRQC